MLGANLLYFSIYFYLNKFYSRFSKVCRLWRDVSLIPSLWSRADLNTVKESARTDLRIHWLILNRLVECEDINMGISLCHQLQGLSLILFYIIAGEWKVRDIQAFLEALCEHCTKLKGLNLSGWKGITPDQLKYLTTECKTLERLDLSNINVSCTTGGYNLNKSTFFSFSVNSTHKCTTTSESESKYVN